MLLFSAVELYHLFGWSKFDNRPMCFLLNMKILTDIHPSCCTTSSGGWVIQLLFRILLSFRMLSCCKLYSWYRTPHFIHTYLDRLFWMFRSECLFLERRNAYTWCCLLDLDERFTCMLTRIGWICWRWVTRSLSLCFIVQISIAFLCVLEVNTYIWSVAPEGCMGV